MTLTIIVDDFEVSGEEGRAHVEDGITAVFYPKNDLMRMHHVEFDDTKFTEEQANAWVKSRPQLSKKRSQEVEEHVYNSDIERIATDPRQEIAMGREKKKDKVSHGIGSFLSDKREDDQSFADSMEAKRRPGGARRDTDRTNHVESRKRSKQDAPVRRRQKRSKSTREVQEEREESTRGRGSADEYFTVREEDTLPGFTFKRNHIYLEPTLTRFRVLKSLPTNSVDLCFTDPPYNLGKKYKSGLDDAKRISDYEDWCSIWIRELERIVKPTGHILIFCWNKFLRMMLRTMERELERNNKFTYHDIVYWKTTGVPQPANKRLRNIIVPIPFWRGKSKNFTWNLDTIRTWEDVKYAYRTNVFGKDPGNCWEFEDKDGYRALIENLMEDGYDFAERGENSCWYAPYVSSENKNRLVLPSGVRHPCQLPVEVCLRGVKLLSNPGDLVLDLFNGTGTTGHACKITGRYYIGIDASEEYVYASTERLNRASMTAADHEKFWKPQNGYPTYTSDVPDWTGKWKNEPLWRFFDCNPAASLGASQSAQMDSFEVPLTW